MNAYALCLPAGAPEAEAVKGEPCGPCARLRVTKPAKWYKNCHTIPRETTAQPK